MKKKKLLAVLLAVIMTVSSVGITAMAVDGTSGNSLAGIDFVDVKVSSNSENTAKGFSCTFDSNTMPVLTTDWSFELKCGDKLLSETTVKSGSGNIGRNVGSVFICWTGDNAASGTWSTTVIEENITTADKPDTLVMHVGGASRNFGFTLIEPGSDTFKSLANVEDPAAVNEITLGDAITSTNSENTIEGFSITFNNIKFSKNLEVNLYYNDTILSTTKMKSDSSLYNQYRNEISCLIGWGGDVASSNHWATELNVANILSVGKETLPNKVVVKLGTTEKEFALDNLVNAVDDAYENFAVFREPTVGTVEWVPSYKTDSQAVSISMGNIGRVHNDMKVELMHDDTVLATTKAKENLQGKRLNSESLSAVIVCDGRFTEASSSWTSELNVNNWARIKPNKVKITNNGVETVCDITTEQGNYDGLKVASTAMTLNKFEAEINTVDGDTRETIHILLSNVGHIENSMEVQLYHDDQLLSTTTATGLLERHGHNYNGLTVQVVCRANSEISGSWSTAMEDGWSLDKLPNKAIVTIDGVEYELAIDNIVSPQKLEKFSAFTNGRKLEISTTPSEVCAGDEVTVAVKIYGQNLYNAEYTIGYNADLFDPKDFDPSVLTDAVAIKNAEDNTAYEDGEVIGTYTFIAKAQTEETTGDFTISDTEASTHHESTQGIRVNTPNNTKASATIKMRGFAGASVMYGDAVLEGTKTIAYDATEHSFTINVTLPAGRTDAYSITYKINDDTTEQTYVDGISVREIGEYTITYTVKGSGYTDYTDTFNVVITDPSYVVEVVDFANENTQAGTSAQKLILVYTNTTVAKFKYDGKNMIDVSGRGYKYNNNTTYTYVYAYVTERVEDQADTYYADQVAYVSDAQLADTVETKKDCTDLNRDRLTDRLDMTVVYASNNVYAQHYENDLYQINILKSDVNCDKKVDGTDITAVSVDAATRKTCDCLNNDGTR